jgi:quinolinate synthase
VWTETNSRIDDADLQSDPRLKYVPASVRGLWDPAKLREKTSPEELAALKAEAARDLELVKAMHGAGVRFMAETAKILNPTRKVVLPDYEAGCSLENSCPPEAFRAWREEHPGAVSLTYINCSAAVKALSDIIVTSSNAEKIVRSIPPEKEILFAPDRHLGAFLAKKTGRPMTLWPGTCIVHEQFSERELLRLKAQHPDALVAAHPECPDSILKYADHVGSTRSILQFATTAPGKTFIIATEEGIIHQMRKLAPDREYLPLPPENGCRCNECPFMKLNTLEKLYLCLRDERPEIVMPEDLRKAAEKPLLRMLELS